MLATLTDAPFDDPGWVFEDKYDGFRMIAEIRRGKVALYSRNGKIISHSYIEVAKALEGVKGDAVIDGELVAIGKDRVSHFQLLQNALRHEVKLLYCAFDLMFAEGEDLRKLPSRTKEAAESDPAARRANRVQPSPQNRRINVSRKARERALKAPWRNAPTAPTRRGDRTADWLKINRQTAGSRDNRLHRSTAYPTVFRRARPRGPGGGRLALHRPRGDRVQS